MVGILSPNYGMFRTSLVVSQAVQRAFHRSSRNGAPRRSGSPRIEDVERFYTVYDAADGYPTALQLQNEYIDPGSDGLHQFAKLRNISGTTIAEALAKHPEMYSGAKRCMAVLPRVRSRLEVAMRTLGRLYPEAIFPAVTIAVGREKPRVWGARLRRPDRSRGSLRD